MKTDLACAHIHVRDAQAGAIIEVLMLVADSENKAGKAGFAVEKEVFRI